MIYQKDDTICCVSDMDLKAEKRDLAEEAQSSTVVQVEPLAQSSPSVAQPSNGEWGNRSALVMYSYIPVFVLTLGGSLLYVSSMQGRKGYMQEFLLSLVVASTVWILVYMIYMRCQKETVCHKDMHAGPLWLRGALCVFGLATLVLFSLKIVFYVNCVHCDVPIQISFVAVEALFILVQAPFFWLHARDCMHVYKNFTRFGLMLTLATNLMLWVVAVTEESLHITGNPEITNYTSQTPGPRGAVGTCYYDHPSCTVMEKAFYYIYPFHIEFCLFCSTMISVMLWNVGRIVDDHPSHRHHFSLRRFLLCLPGGLIVLAVGVVILVIYDMDIKDKKNETLALYYIATTVFITIMIVLSMVGLYMHQKEKSEHASDKNPTCSLDLGLLWGTSSGSLIISIKTIVAILLSGVNSHINALKLAWCVLTLIRVVFQNSFIIEGIRRKPNDAQQDWSQANQSVPHAQEEGRCTTVYKPLTRRRKILKATCIALAFFNITLWVMTAFGARPQFDNPVGIEFYGFQMWAAVVNFCLPFAIFYQMHSANAELLCSTQDFIEAIQNRNSDLDIFGVP